MKIKERFNSTTKYLMSYLISLLITSCGLNNNRNQNTCQMSAFDLLGNPDYPGMSYGGYRGKSRDQQPSLSQLKEDLIIMHTMGIRFLRTYNMQFPHSTNLVKAIDDLKKSDPHFEMYVMLGVWIDCARAWTESPDHSNENYIENLGEINRAVTLTAQYPDIIKVISVGNEAMVHWASSYFVSPKIILNWVNHLQDLKSKGSLPKDLWITSSDNFASWGGGGPEYKNDDLVSLIHAVDYISVHIYPFHDTHYNPSFWTENLKISPLSNDPVNFQKRQFLENQIEILMENALSHSQQQYAQVLKYITDLGIDKPIHIGETGWASLSDGIYGPEGSRAADEYKQALYYHKIMSWTRSIGISCFFFEAFNEPWKSPLNPEDSENHFGLFTTNGKAKYALWPLVEQGIFIGLSRDGSPIEKTQSGHKDTLWSKVLMSSTKINNHNIE